MRIVPLNFDGPNGNGVSSCDVDGLSVVLKGRHPTIDGSYERLFGEKKPCCGKCKTGGQCDSGCACKGNLQRGGVHAPGGGGESSNCGSSLYSSGIESHGVGCAISVGGTPASFGAPRTGVSSASHQGSQGEQEYKASGDKTPFILSNAVSILKKKRKKPGAPIKPFGGPRRNPVKVVEDGKCKAEIQIEIAMDVKNSKKNGCKHADMQAAIKELEDAVAEFWTNANCPCKVSDDKNVGCTFSVNLVWHEKPRGNGVVAFQVRCSAKRAAGKPLAFTTVDESIWIFGGEKNKKEKGRVGVLGHEIGHQLFGRKPPEKKSKKPKKPRTPKDKLLRLFAEMQWDALGHRPVETFKEKGRESGDDRNKRVFKYLDEQRDAGLMAAPMSIDPKLIPEEACAVVAMFNLCDESVCCPGVDVTDPKTNKVSKEKKGYMGSPIAGAYIGGHRARLDGAIALDLIAPDPTPTTTRVRSSNDSIFEIL